MTHPKRFNLLVTGGRRFHQTAYIYNVLDQIHAHRPITLLVHGNAMGTDSIAGAWAVERGVPLAIFPANWKGENKAAGPLRNQRILDTVFVDGCVAFPGDRGTNDMIDRVNRAKISLMDLSKQNIQKALA